jgi:ATP-dependent exoDNAse (exonuclease V) alpha subunit
MNTIKTFVSNHSEEIQIIANGDVNQLKPISSGVNNVTNENTYRMESVQSIFPNIVTLKEIKRLNKQADKIKMHKIKKEIFKGTPIAEICETFGIRTVTDMKDVNTTNNIAYFNYRCNYVNKVIHGKAKRPDVGVTNVEGIDVWKDLILVCKKFYKNSAGFKTYVNNSYRVESIGKYIKLVDSADESNVFSMERDKLWKIFNLAYCNTCHSVQGCSIDEEVTIFDCNTPYVDRFWLYTAITRCRELNNISVFIHDEKQLRTLEKCKFKQYINNKIDGYVDQDKLAGREITTDYVDYGWFENEFAKKSMLYALSKWFRVHG